MNPTKDLALEAFRKNAPTDEVLAALDVDVTAPITPYAFQFGLLGKAKSNKKTNRAARRRGGPHHQGGPTTCLSARS